MSRETGSEACTVSEEEREWELLVLKVQAQLEELFSDSHLAEDGFLLKHIQKNKEGFVILKLLTALKKIHVFTDNCCMTLAAALFSDLLEVNDGSMKVRRVEPYPEWLLSSPNSKLLLVRNLPKNQTHVNSVPQNLDYTALSDQILQKFSAYGNVTAFWMLPPGKVLPKELQCYVKQHMELGRCLSAVVKYDSLDAVWKAYSSFKAEEMESVGKGIHVITLGYKSTYLISQEQLLKEKKQAEAEVSNRVEEEPCPREMSKNLTSQTVGTPNQATARLTTVQPEWSTRDVMQGAASQIPWVLRRKQALLDSKMSRNKRGPVLKVLRLPYGPDGTKGFHNNCI